MRQWHKFVFFFVGFFFFYTLHPSPLIPLWFNMWLLEFSVLLPALFYFILFFSTSDDGQRSALLIKADFVMNNSESGWQTSCDCAHCCANEVEVIRVFFIYFWATAIPALIIRGDDASPVGYTWTRICSSLGPLKRQQPPAQSHTVRYPDKGRTYKLNIKQRGDLIAWMNSLPLHGVLNMHRFSMRSDSPPKKNNDLKLLIYALPSNNPVHLL